MRIAIALMAGALAYGQADVEKGRPVTESERAALVQELSKGADAFAASVRGLSEEQAKWKPAPDRWSAMEIAEHAAMTAEMLFVYATQKVLPLPVKAEVAGRSAEAIAAGDAGTLKAMPDRSKKAKAPGMLHPAGKFATMDAAVAAIRERHAKVAEYVKTTQDDLRGHGTVGPDGRVTDVYQYLLMVASHPARHALQVEEVKAAAGFPK